MSTICSLKTLWNVKNGLIKREVTLPGFTSFTETLLRERTRIVFLLTLSHMYALESLKISLYVKLSSDNKEIDLSMY